MNLWDSQANTAPKTQPAKNVRRLKTPNALFQISLEFPRELSGFIPRSSAYGMPVKTI